MKNVELNIPLLDAEIKAHRMKQGEFSEQPSVGVSREAKILENIVSKLDKIQSEIEEIKEAQDKIWSKVHANTIQMERLKDMWK